MVIRKVVIGFPKDVPVGWYDKQSPIEPFGPLWGKGAVGRDSQGYYVIAGSYSTSHAELKKILSTMTIIKTFYFGVVEDTLYFHDGFIGEPFQYDDEIEYVVLDYLRNNKVLGMRFRL